MTNSLEGWSNIIMNTPIDHRIQHFDNAKCLRCCVVSPYMVKVGPMTFCRHCCESQFGNLTVYNPKTMVYKLWLAEYFNQW